MLLPGVPLSPRRPAPAQGPAPTTAQGPASAAPRKPAPAPAPAASLASGGASSSTGWPAGSGPAAGVGASSSGGGGGSGGISSLGPGVSEKALRRALTCPLTRRLLEDPVICEDGLSYERAAVAGGPGRTRPNFALKQLLDSLALQ
jgi:hypothetical protein